MEPNKQIPQAFKKFFWDADFSKLSLPEHQNYILGKLMMYGDIESIQWILRTFDHTTVYGYLKKKGEHTLDKNSLRFWKKLMDMDDLWLPT
jgi:hypothetical protein